MDLRYTFHTDSKILEVQYKGVATPAVFCELYDYVLDACEKREDRYNRLWDLRGVDYSHLADPEVRAILAAVLHRLRHRIHRSERPERVAVVVDSDVGFGHLRKFGILFNLSGENSVAFQVVRSYDEALEFLFQPATLTPPAVPLNHPG